MSSNNLTEHGQKNYLIHAVLLLLVIGCLIPVILVVSISTSTEEDIYLHGYRLLPKNFTLNAYRHVLANPAQLFQSYFVTILATMVGTLLDLMLITSLAYVIYRRDYKFRNITTFFVFFTLLFNGGLVPTYILIAKWLHLRNTFPVLFIPLMVNPWFILFMKGFMNDIPHSLVESAKIDGANEITIFLRIVIPLAKTGIATISLFLILQIWNDWFQSLLYIDNENLYTLQYLLLRIAKQTEFLNRMLSSGAFGATANDLPALSSRMATAILAVGPLLFVFPFFQRYFIKGITIGSLKG